MEVLCQASPQKVPVDPPLEVLRLEEHSGSETELDHVLAAQQDDARVELQVDIQGVEHLRRGLCLPYNVWRCETPSLCSLVVDAHRPDCPWRRMHVRVTPQPEFPCCVWSQDLHPRDLGMGVTVRVLVHHQPDICVRVPFAHPSDIVFQTSLIRTVASDQQFTVSVQVRDEGFQGFVEPRELFFAEGARKWLEDGDSSRVRSSGAVPPGSGTHHQDECDQPPGNAYARPKY